MKSLVARRRVSKPSMDFLNFADALHERTKLDIPETDYPGLFSLDGAIVYLGRNRGSD